MANRTVSVRLQAEIGQYVSSMSKASAATMRLGDDATASSAKANRGFDMAGKGALLLGGAVVAGLGLAVSASMKFEKAMSAASAATQQSGAALDDLRDAAMKAGADTQYSATEAADAITEMGKAGVSTADILNGGLDGALALAAAGQMDVAEAAELGATAMNVFNLKGDQMSHVADLLAAGAGKAQGSVSDMGAALNQSALVANAAGLSIEETAGSLALFASNGLIGSDAGTSFRQMLLHLQAPSGTAQKQMDALGISMYDANGEFIGMTALAEQLQTQMAGLTQAERDKAMATIFGADAVRASNILYEAGGEGVAAWTAKVNDAGFAADTAAALTDNLSGDLERLGGAWDTLLITLGQGAQGGMREVVQALEGMVEGVIWLVEAWGNLPGPVQAAIIALGGIALLKGPVGSALESIQLRAMYAADAIMSPRAGLATAGSKLLSVFGGPWGLALAGAVTGLTLLTSWLGRSSVSTEQAAAYQDRLTTALEESNGALNENVRAIAAREAADTDIGDSNLLEVSRELGIELPRVTDALLGNKAAYEEIEGAADAYLQRALELSDFNTEDPGFIAASEKVAGYKGALEALFPNLAEIEQGQQDVAVATSETGVVAQQTTVMTEEATKALEDWLKALQDIATDFVDPLEAYKGLLDAKMAKERESAEATAAATEDASDSWEDYATDVTVSLNELADKLEEQLLAHDQWARNIGTITQRGGADVGRILAQMGEEGVQIAAQMANGTDAEFNRMADLLRRGAQRAGGDAVAEFDYYMKMMELVGASGGTATVQGLASALGLGVDQVRYIAGMYGLSLAEGINPILGAVGRTPVIVARGSQPNSGSLSQPGFAEGGYTGPGAKYQPAGIVHAGEYVLTQEQVKRLGLQSIEAFANRGYANGGFVTSADVPRPYSTAPAGYPVSTAGDGTMETGYSAVTSWLDYLNALRAAQEAAAAAAAATAAGPLGGGAVGGSWQSIWEHVHRAIPEARINSTYRAGDPGYHGKGKAIDFGFGTGPGGAGSAGLASINRYIHDTIGVNLAELIYDGIGDDRPDLKNGRPLTYSASTQAEHRNHVHAATYDQGGTLRPGFTMAYNGTGRNETIRTASQEAALSGPQPVLLQLEGDAVTALLRGEVVETLGTRRAINTIETGLVVSGRERA